MTKRKANPHEAALTAGLRRTSLTAQIEGQLLGVAADPAEALTYFPDDAELAHYVAQGAAPLVCARLVELHIAARAALVEDLRDDSARRRRSKATSARNKADAAAVRAAALKKFDRLMAAGGRTKAEALRDGWPDKSERDRVRGWVTAQHAPRNKGL